MQIARISFTIQFLLVSHHAIVVPNPTIRDSMSKDLTDPRRGTCRNLIFRGNKASLKQRLTAHMPKAQQSASAIPFTTEVKKTAMIPEDTKTVV